jgi:N-acetylmuramoyl-L-alanine amidase
MVRGTIVFDPGHGGSNTGAIANGIVEKDWTLAFCKRMLNDIASEETKVWSCDLVRWIDEDVGLITRGTRSKAAGADLVISVHVNAMATHPEWHGLMTYYWPGNTIARDVASIMMRAAPKPLYKAGPGATSCDEALGAWIEAPRNVLRVHDAPTVLLEVGYCTNESDALALADPAVVAGLRSMVRVGLARFFYLQEHAR